MLSKLFKKMRRKPKHLVQAGDNNHVDEPTHLETVPPRGSSLAELTHWGVGVCAGRSFQLLRSGRVDDAERSFKVLKVRGPDLHTLRREAGNDDDTGFKVLKVHGPDGMTVGRRCLAANMDCSNQVEDAHVLHAPDHTDPAVTTTERHDSAYDTILPADGPYDPVPSFPLLPTFTLGWNTPSPPVPPKDAIDPSQDQPTIPSFPPLPCLTLQLPPRVDSMEDDGVLDGPVCFGGWR
ncbi:uncharacterized protein SPPG_04642 [Spizellomyces punctatus DAOM BR117]|uniref:Uncharacterized protein n=1 Tax=Spizellomyces punctatus (strain DAOM BR117) TaxID=645134 RepID=A0A0L0HGS9_SPIPD|nr:uncharacterized protein SPPG_04642 [Spizellomyces punctatus DAOM BR117]KND00318.1 hypothetical protein SPPG_04642 [Spizellomyces punctatus DAOM BR117]|eukprot:XP_016608357.1 hypothetical protein SPPG_04642 [Spizellomyces punctatus DAOM BR117]